MNISEKGKCRDAGCQVYIAIDSVHEKKKK